ncbi:MAG: hypothetical protein OEV40_25125 [Acidimicrobiia bacterium]|nr:hypothetical protein [Acidimicrobiia bacterium]
MGIDDTTRRIGRLLDEEGGRIAVELGLDLDDHQADVDRWFLAATLFGAPIRASVAKRTWRVLADAGVRTVVDAGERSWDDLVGLLDAGGYGRYDFRTATRLHELAAVVAQKYGGSITALADEPDPESVAKALQDLPGWGPTTTGVFLRELRGVWPGADVPVNDRARAAARQLRIPLGRSSEQRWSLLAEQARQADVDPRDLEAALIRRAVRLRLPTS